MTEITLNRCARLAVHAVAQLNDGTLGHPHKAQRPYWPAFRIPERIVLLPIRKPEFSGGDGNRNDNWVFQRGVEVYGTATSKNVLLATVELRGCTYRHQDQAITDDDGSWRVQEIKYLGVESDGNGGWKEVTKNFSNINGMPLIESLGI